MQEDAVNEPGPVPGAQPAVELARSVSEALGASDHERVRALARGLEPPDLADLIELLEPAQRVPLIEVLGAAFRPEVLSELDEPRCATQLLPALPKDLLAKAVAELETDDAAYLLESLEPSRSGRRSWRSIPTVDRAAVERNLEYPQETAGRLMQTDFVAVPPFWTVGPGDRPHARGRGPAGDLLRHLRRRSDLSRARQRRSEPAAAHQAAGAASTPSWTRAATSVLATADQEAVARQFERYDLKSAPVVDANKRLVGVVTVDDVVEVIEEEADEDILRAGRRRRRAHHRQRAPDRASPLLVAAGQPGHRDPRLRRHQAVRRHHRAHGGARRADADRGLHGRQRRHPDHDGRRAGAGHRRARRHQHRPGSLLRETADGLINGLAFAVIMGLGHASSGSAPPRWGW